MKKKLLVLLLAGVMAIPAGCGKKPVENAGSLSAEAEIPTTDSTYSNDYVDLGEYKKIPAVKNIYTVTQEDIDTEIRLELSGYAEYNEVSRGAKEGDYVTISFTASIKGETDADKQASDSGEPESYEIVLGEGEYGKDFDAKITGAKAGDSLDFSVSYSEEEAESGGSTAAYAGKTVDYHVDVESVSEEILPEYTDEFVEENIGEFHTREEFEQDIRKTIEEEYAEASETEVQDYLISQVLENSTIKDYPESLYQAFYNYTLSNYEGYAAAFGQPTDKEDLLEMFDMTEDDLAAEALASLHRYLVVDAIAETENITVSDADFDAAIDRYLVTYEYPDRETFLADYDEDLVRDWALEEKVLDFLEENAVITEQKADYPKEEW